MVEIGIVKKVEARLAEVEIEPANGCSRCVSRSSCHIGEEKSKRVVAVQNQFNAVNGDLVEIEVAARNVISSAFLIFILPLLGLIGGYCWGIQYGQGWGILLALVGIGASFILLRLLDFVIRRQNDWQPAITRIIQHNSNSTLI